MPSVTWKIDHDRKWVMATAAGPLTSKDLAEYLAAVAAAGGGGYRSIFDARNASVQLAAKDLRGFSEVVAAGRIETSDGAVAIVVASEAETDIAAILAARTKSHRNVRVFTTLAEASAWFADLDASGGDAPRGGGQTPDRAPRSSLRD